jgi:hypothetical protein
MGNRPGGLSRRLARTPWLEIEPASTVRWGGLTVLVVLVLVVESALPVPGTWRAFLAGFTVASGLAGVGWMATTLAGDPDRTSSRPGEEATAAVVAGRRRRWKGWRLVNGLYLSGHGDIDHILVGPRGVFVIESKWTSSPCRIERGEIVGLLGRVTVAQAGNGAVKVERLLRLGGQRLDVNVTPVVVIWGPGGLRLDQGSTEIDGVLVCEGRRHRDWLRQLDGPALDPRQVEDIIRMLEDQVTRQIDRRPAHIRSGPHPGSLYRTATRRASIASS